MNKERLLKLADFLDSMPEKVAENFTLEYWGRPKSDYKEKGFDCGFSGCAIGWACQAELFPGLFMGGASPIYDDRLTGGTQMYSDWEAIMKLFDISNDQAKLLFVDASYSIYYDSNEEYYDVAPSVVAKRIRNLCSWDVQDGAN